jgi:hypothetical protein
MIPFIIKKKLVNVPSYSKSSTEYEVYAICKGFQTYDLDGFKVGENINVNPIIAINALSLKIDLAWCLNDIIDKIQPTIYQLKNDIWFNSEGEKVPKQIHNPDYIEGGEEPEFIDNPEAVITEVDYWLNLMVNVDVNDRYLIEQGFERLDLVNHYWANIQL